MAFPLYPLIYSLTEFAPLIGRWISGDEGEKIAHHVVNTAHAITGQNDPQKVIQSLKTDPKLVIEFQQAVLKMEQELDIALYKDRESARVRDIALAQAGRHNLRADIMVISAAFGLIACLLTITFFRMTLPGEAVGIISTIAGIFGSCLKDAYAFEFGSSRGSKLKDSKLQALFMARG